MKGILVDCFQLLIETTVYPVRVEYVTPKDSLCVRLQCEPRAGRCLVRAGMVVMMDAEIYVKKDQWWVIGKLAGYSIPNQAARCKLSGNPPNTRSWRSYPTRAAPSPFMEKNQATGSST